MFSTFSFETNQANRDFEQLRARYPKNSERTRVGDETVERIRKQDAVVVTDDVDDTNDTDANESADEPTGCNEGRLRSRSRDGSIARTR